MYAQNDIGYEIDSVMNHLYADTLFSNKLLPFDTTPDYVDQKWNSVYDSITDMVVRKHIETDVISKDYYPYPRFALGMPYSPTYSYLLQKKYNVRRPISHGCVIPNYQYKYDSLVADILRNKFGENIFEYALKEGEKLDSQNKGLCLPHCLVI